MKQAKANGERYKNLMIKEVIPTIKARMPRLPGHTIFVLQDGAKPHTGKGIMEAIQDAAGDITQETQPANSPDLNVNDFDFYHSIQQLKESAVVTNGKELVEATMKAFNVYPEEIDEEVWQSLFAVNGEVMGCKGNNSYEMPHLGKEKLTSAGNLPQ
ncbi:unnamed protein product, partial [Discosporangium mesarthrocarpum]